MEDISIEEGVLKSFLGKVNRGEIGSEEKSEKPKSYKVSRKTVFNDFSELLKDDFDHVVLFYSKNCPSCKFIQPQFEKLALRNLMLKEMPNVKFHRVNNSLNSFFLATPVLIYLKNNYDNPFIFQGTPTYQNIHDFVRITSKFEVIPDYAPPRNPPTGH